MITHIAQVTHRQDARIGVYTVLPAQVFLLLGTEACGSTHNQTVLSRQQHQQVTGRSFADD